MEATKHDIWDGGAVEKVVGGCSGCIYVSEAATNSTVKYVEQPKRFTPPRVKVKPREGFSSGLKVMEGNTLREGLRTPPGGGSRGDWGRKSDIENEKPCRDGQGVWAWRPRSIEKEERLGNQETSFCPGRMKKYQPG